MKKTLIALAALGAFAGYASAQSSVTIYGIVDAGVVKATKNDVSAALGGAAAYSTNGTAPYTYVAGGKETSINPATKSRLGFKVEEDIGGGLSAKVQLEHRLNPDSGAQTSSSEFWDMSTVSLTSSSIGELKLGRDYMPAFYSQYLLDPWRNEGIAEMGGTTYAFAGYITPIGPDHNVRYNNGVWFSTKLGGLTAIISSGQSEAHADGVGNRMGLAAIYQDGPLFVTAAYDKSDSDGNLALAGVTGKKDSLMILGGSYDFGFIKPRLSYAKSTVNTSTTETNPTSWTLAATVPVGNDIIKLGYTQLKWDGLATGIGASFKANAGDFGAGPGSWLATSLGNQSKLSLGYEKVLSKRTSVYADFTHGHTKSQTNAVNAALPAAPSYNVNAYDLGIRHSF